MRGRSAPCTTTSTNKKQPRQPETRQTSIEESTRGPLSLAEMSFLVYSRFIPFIVLHPTRPSINTRTHKREVTGQAPCVTLNGAPSTAGFDPCSCSNADGGRSEGKTLIERPEARTSHYQTSLALPQTAETLSSIPSSWWSWWRERGEGGRRGRGRRQRRRRRGRHRGWERRWSQGGRWGWERAQWAWSPL
mmetsp:Transcript_41706/g.82319  ORF Transcript_41706/g.82319 Transcript_41706/m.82319 type:complete len:191 (+) Transcript_41706:595-1167(+)